MNTPLKNDSILPIAVVVGATGLVGRELIHQLLVSGHYREIYAVVRQRFDLGVLQTSAQLTSLIWIEIPDFTQLKQVLKKYDFQGADVFSTLGSTQKQAGSKAAFYNIDHDYNLAFAEVTAQQGARHLLLVSAMGADVNSLIYYNRVKGKLEQDVQRLNFAYCSIFRPSLLLGEREDARFLEGIAQHFFQWGQRLLPKNFAARPISAEQVAVAMRQAAFVKSKLATQNQHHTAVEVTIYSNKMMLNAS